METQAAVRRYVLAETKSSTNFVARIGIAPDARCIHKENMPGYAKLHCPVTDYCLGNFRLSRTLSTALTIR
jgi:hypothetical protein